MGMQNLNDLFTASTLTDVINEVPNQYGKVMEMGVFRERPIATSHVTVENVNGALKLIDPVSYGAPAQVTNKGSRTRRIFELLHHPLEENIDPSEIRSILGANPASATTEQLEGMAGYLAQRLEALRMHHDQTREWHQLNALKGRIVDSAGNVIYDLFNEFGVTELTVDFQLSSATTDVKRKVSQVIQHIRKNLKGDRMTGVHAFVSSDFFDALIDHASVKEVWRQWASTQISLGRDPWDQFQFAGITFERYDASVTAADGTTQVDFFSTAEGRAFPIGTTNTFIEAVGPADFNDVINTMGRPYYARVEENPFGRGYRLHTQSNLLPICARPAVLVKLITT